VRFRIESRLIGALFLIIGLAGSASAQKIDHPLLGAGLSFLNLQDATGVGFAVDLAQTVSRMDRISLAVAGDLGLNHFDFGTDTTFQVGVRVDFKTPNPKVKPFAQGLAGIEHFGASNCDGNGCGDTNFVFSPGGGIDLAVSRKTNFRAELSFPIVHGAGIDFPGPHGPDEIAHDTRFWVGLSFGLGK
jgi:hypothetical protein